ncbi:pimeloyl-ACP methyl ester carboxylesterase [Actinoplanes octamycinicus]|uniref:Pimeloyl-ACP methyl ester carboxylesterase n=1 Tax=Actinoplanes octamycinicus TaxID=135948 RepID=A0A7W7H0I1_9ACTN|nr:alpha/beta hydrolase [Actinoplanes octamycinicus]MBB4741683.1 pimeloyl-ACP methyl ester carboxylesterase [Actinoplanes octamycinicus]GIE57236.1 alpha/beta hydrolase [Actinoplanes octamycinicus]
MTITIRPEDVPVRGAGAHTFLLLHGGAGPGSMAGFADLLAERTGSRVLLPTHPGFGGTPRPDAPATTRDLAAAYAELLDRLGLSGVTVVGNSFGGWLAAELALLGGPRVGRAVIVDGIGAEVPGHPMTSVAGLDPAGLRRLSFHDERKAPRPPAGGGPGPDIAALVGYAGPAMSDPTLLERLAAVTVPVHVIWGESDGIVGVEYGKAYAGAMPHATFTVLPETGHLPQLETPGELLDAIRSPVR